MDATTPLIRSPRRLRSWARPVGEGIVVRVGAGVSATLEQPVGVKTWPETVQAVALVGFYVPGHEHS